MKTLLAFCLLAVLGYAGWSYSHRSQPQANAPQTEQPEVAAATATPIAAPTAQTPAPNATVVPTRHLAPAGTVFLLAYRSVRTPHGFNGFPPGTPVTVAEDKGTTLLVRGDGTQFEVSKSEVTNDVDLANRVAGNDSAEQQALFAKGYAASNAADLEKRKQMQAEADSIQQAASAPREPQASSVRSKNGNVKLVGWTTADSEGHYAVVGLGDTVAAARSNALREITSSLGGKPFTIVREDSADHTNGHPYRIVYAVQ